MNSFGTLFRITLWGESHGPQIGVTLDGVPAGLPLDIPDFEADLARRRSGIKGRRRARKTTCRRSCRDSTRDTPRAHR